MTLFARLESRNQLLAELIKTGAEPAEAQRLATLAESISQTHLDIDPDYVLAVETLLRRDRPGVPANVISITHYIRRPVFAEHKRQRMYALPTTYMRKRKVVRRMAPLSIAAAFAAVAVLVAPHLDNEQPVVGALHREENHRSIIRASEHPNGPRNDPERETIVHRSDSGSRKNGSGSGSGSRREKWKEPADETQRGRSCTLSDKEIHTGVWVATPTCRGTGVAGADL